MGLFNRTTAVTGNAVLIKPRAVRGALAPVAV